MEYTTLAKGNELQKKLEEASNEQFNIEQMIEHIGKTSPKHLQIVATFKEEVITFTKEESKEILQLVKDMRTKVVEDLENEFYSL